MITISSLSTGVLEKMTDTTILIANIRLYLCSVHKNRVYTDRDIKRKIEAMKPLKTIEDREKLFVLYKEMSDRSTSHLVTAIDITELMIKVMSENKIIGNKKLEKLVRCVYRYSSKYIDFSKINSNDPVYHNIVDFLNSYKRMKGLCKCFTTIPKII